MILVFISFLCQIGISHLWCVCFYTMRCDKEGNRFWNVTHSLRIQANKACNFFLQRIGVFKSTMEISIRKVLE